MFINKDYIFVLTKYASRGANFLIVFLITFLIEESLASQWTLDWSIFRILFPMFTFGQEILYYSQEEKNNQLDYLFFLIILGLVISIGTFLFLDPRFSSIVIANVLLGCIRLNGMLIRNSNINKSVFLEDLLPALLLLISTFLYIYLNIGYFTSLSLVSGITFILIVIQNNLAGKLKFSTDKFLKHLYGFYPIVFSGIFASMGYFNRFFIEYQLGSNALIQYQILFQTFLIIPIFINGINTIQSKNFKKNEWHVEFKRFNKTITVVGVATIIVINTFVFRIIDLIKPTYFNSDDFLIFSIFMLLTTPLYASMIFVQLLKLNYRMIPISMFIILTQILLFSIYDLSLKSFIILHGVGTFTFYLSCNIIIKAHTIKIFTEFFKNKAVILTMIYLLIKLFSNIWVEISLIFIIIYFILINFKKWVKF